MTTPMPAAYFDRLYADHPDPWRFATSDYERAKYDDTIASLDNRNFRSGFEIGCSIGILTKRLAPYCRDLLAIDVAAAALASARRNCARYPQVKFERRRVPDNWPERQFDLIILSEMLYFLSPDEICQTAQRACDSLLPGGLILLVHWTEPTDYPAGGNEAAECFIAACAGRLHPDRKLIRRHYRLDRIS